jgi:hypothetical protein
MPSSPIRLARRTLLACVLGAAAASGALLLPADASAQSTTRPEFLVGTPITAKADHSLPSATRMAPRIKAGTVGKVTKVYSSGGKIIYLDIEVGVAKGIKVPVAFVRDNYRYPQ